MNETAVKYFKDNISVLPIDVFWDAKPTEEEHDRNLSNYINALLSRFTRPED